LVIAGAHKVDLIWNVENNQIYVLQKGSMNAGTFEYVDIEYVMWQGKIRSTPVLI
jgi:hypothetical protein